MASFKTTDGAEWIVSVNVATVKRVRDSTGIDLLSIMTDGKTVAGLFADSVKLAEVLAAAIWPGLRQAGKSAEDFMAVLNGPALESATEALMREIANFSREPQRSLLLAAIDKVMAESEKMDAAGAAAALEALESMEIALPSQSTHTSFALSSPAPAA